MEEVVYQACILSVHNKAVILMQHFSQANSYTVCDKLIYLCGDFMPLSCILWLGDKAFYVLYFYSDFITHLEKDTKCQGEKTKQTLLWLLFLDNCVRSLEAQPILSSCKKSIRVCLHEMDMPVLLCLLASILVNTEETRIQLVSPLFDFLHSQEIKAFFTFKKCYFTLSHLCSVAICCLGKLVWNFL